MGEQYYINLLNKAWSFDGFLGNLKEGRFDKVLYDELYDTLKKIDIPDNAELSRELVQLLWFIPIFMYRQKEYLIDIQSKNFDALRENIEEELARILLYP